MNNHQQQLINSLSDVIEPAANRAAAAFAEMLNLPVSVQLSRAELIEKDQAWENLTPTGGNWSKAVHIHFDAEISGEALMLIPSGHEANLASAFLEMIPGLDELDNPEDAIFTEIGNVLLNACIGTIANQMGWHVTYQPPRSIQISKISHFLAQEPGNPKQLLRLISTLEVGQIAVKTYIILIFKSNENPEN